MYNLIYVISTDVSAATAVFLELRESGSQFERVRGKMQNVENLRHVF